MPKATHSNILAWRIPWTVFHGVAKSLTQLSDFHFHFCLWDLNSLIRDSIWAPEVKAMSPNHWTTRGFPQHTSIVSVSINQEANMA